MPELYLRILDRVLTPVLIMLALFLLLRGHNLPGGGFIAGLMAAAAFQLQILSRGDGTVRREVGHYLQPATGLGLLIAAGAGTIGVFGHDFLKGVWWHLHVGFLEIEIGTPVIFDLGVFLVVVSVGISYLLELNKASERK
jgi:multicomponent Na+:H+ antiporter subunit B